MSKLIKGLFLFSIVTITSLAISQAATITDGYGSWQATIQDAIDSSIAGQTITVDSYTANEKIIVNKWVTINATNTTLDWAGTDGTMISIQSDGVTINGFKITNVNGEGISTKGAAGLSGITITNNEIYGINSLTITGEIKYPSGAGIMLWSINGYLFRNGSARDSSNFTNSLAYSNVLVDGNNIYNLNYGMGIFGVDGNNVTISHNNIHDTMVGGEGIWIDSSNHITFDNNTFDSTYNGVIISSYKENIIFSTYATTGAFVSSDLSFLNNTIQNTKKTARYEGNGLLFYGSNVSSMVISGNSFINNPADIYGTYSSNDIITATYNYYMNSPNNTISITGTINTDPYYVDATMTRLSNNLTTGEIHETLTGFGDNGISFDTQIIETNDGTFSGLMITIGTGTNTTGVDSFATTTATTTASGYEVLNTQFSSLDVGTYSYEISYDSDGGVDVTKTGSFDIDLVAYGCTTQTHWTPAIYFNTSSGNVTMVSSSLIFGTTEGRHHASVLNNTGDFYAFDYEYLSNPSTFNVYYGAQNCNWY